MKLTIEEARDLGRSVLRKYRFNEEDTEIVVNHLIDAHLTGYTFAGLPRLLVVLERIRNDRNAVPGPVRTIRETAISAVLDGSGNLGYVACWRAVQIAISKAKQSGIAIVSVANTHYSGRSGYYAEEAARAGLAVIHVSHASAMVAPIGGTTPVLGSNPVTIAVPSSQGPLMCDFSTAASTWGELQLAERYGEKLPEGVAIDNKGVPTTDPSRALQGAVLPWGGHKGYALGTLVQALGILSGGEPVPSSHGSFGFLFIVWQPDLLLPSEDFSNNLDTLFSAIRASGDGVRLPGERSSAERVKRVKEGTIELPDHVVEAIRSL